MFFICDTEVFPQAEKLHIQLMGIEAVSQDGFMASFLWFEAFSIFSSVFHCVVAQNLTLHLLLTSHGCCL